MVLTVDHACLQVALGDRDPAAVRADLSAKFAAISLAHGLDPGQYPSCTGAVAKGWRREPGRGLVRTGIGGYSFFSSDTEIVIDSGADGRHWLTLDTCSTRAMGSIDGLVSLGSLNTQGKWRRGTKFVEWKPEDGEKVIVDAMA
jgi:hypothetical protein